MARHDFGGLWTRVKLEVIRKYLAAYSTALSKTKLRLHYADAFAGTGSQDIRSIDQQNELIPLEAMKGSARIALECNGFHKYHFNDLSPDHVQALESIRADHPEKTISITQLDANVFIDRFCNDLRPTDRAVLFIDPYSTQLRWESLQKIAAMKNIDMWLLFPISSLTRLTPREGANPIWEAKVSAMLGTTDWTKDLYVSEEYQGTHDMFNETPGVVMERLDQKGLEGYITSRLGSIFSYASEPLVLRNSRTPMFLLYFAMTNDSPAALGLAKKLVTSVLKQPVPH